jgi:hypothetical protein
MPISKWEMRRGVCCVFLIKEGKVPRQDQCEPQIVRALEKAGWRVTDHNFALQTGKLGRFIFADLRLVDIQTGQQIIVVEVKCFPQLGSVIDEFHRAYGQYNMYRKALAKNGLKIPIYLAVPAHMYEILIDDSLIAEMMNEGLIKRIIVDVNKEEVTQWIE